MNSITTLSASNVLVFGTNIRNEHDLAIIGDLMDNDIRIQRWTVDREDCDKVLRIVAHDVAPEEIIQRICLAGYACREL